MEKLNNLQIQILKCISEKGTFSDVLQNQVPYSQIVSELMILNQNNYIQITEEKLALTDIGHKELQKLKKYVVFEKLIKYKLPKSQCINIDDIYIPELEWEA